MFILILSQSSKNMRAQCYICVCFAQGIFQVSSDLDFQVVLNRLSTFAVTLSGPFREKIEADCRIVNTVYQGPFLRYFSNLTEICAKSCIYEVDFQIGHCKLG